MEFRASWSIGVRLISLVVIALLGVITAVFALSEAMPVWTKLVAAGVFLAVTGGSWLLAPQGYEVSGGEFRVLRAMGASVIPLPDITAVRELSAADLSGTIRLFGNGGLFGFYGWMYSPKLGWQLWYATRRDNYVLIETAKRKLIVTPDEPAQLVRTLRAALGLQ